MKEYMPYGHEQPYIKALVRSKYVFLSSIIVLRSQITYRVC